MVGELKGSIFKCSDGYKYYKVKRDVGKTKLYLRCYKHRKGCRVNIHTEYADKNEKNLRVIYRNGVHNHPAPLGVSKNELRRSNSTKESSNTLNSDQQNVLPPPKYVVYVYQ